MWPSQLSIDPLICYRKCLSFKDLGSVYEVPSTIKKMLQQYRSGGYAKL